MFIINGDNLIYIGKENIKISRSCFCLFIIIQVNLPRYQIFKNLELAICVLTLFVKINVLIYRKGFVLLSFNFDEACVFVLLPEMAKIDPFATVSFEHLCET